MKLAICHPHRRWFSGGLCSTCWRARPALARRKATCHPERPHQAKGLCLDCYNQSRRENRDAHAARLRYNFGLTREQYDEILKAQGGGCAICGRTDLGAKVGRGRNTKLLGVDHCHRTNLVRGILCHKCNLGIGHLNDDLGLVWKAMVYLAAPRTIIPAASPLRKQRKGLAA